MDYKKFIKNNFLNQTIGSYSDNFCNANYQKVEKEFSNCLVWFVPRKVVTSNRQTIHTIFDHIDSLKKKNGLIEKDEIYILVKQYYSEVKHQNVTDEQISQMKMSTIVDVLGYIIDHL